MLQRLEKLENQCKDSDRLVLDTEERMSIEMQRHNVLVEEKLAQMEERIATMLRGQREEVQRTVERGAKEAADLFHAVSEGRRDDLLERERFQQGVLDEVKVRASHWDGLHGEMKRQLATLEDATRRAAQEAASRHEATIHRLQEDVRDMEARLAGEVRVGVGSLREAEQRLQRAVEAKLEGVSSAARDLEAVRRDVVRLDTERLRLKDQLVAKVPLPPPPPSY